MNPACRCPKPIDMANREDAMVVIQPGIWCDPCITDLVSALNAGDVPTVASCCGHDRNTGSIILADGRLLTISTFEP